MNATLERALYYWGWYKVNGEIDFLVSASTWLNDYRKTGGTDRPDLDGAINAVLQPLLSPLPKAGKAPVLATKDTPQEPLIFGYTSRQIAAMQGGANDLS